MDFARGSLTAQKAKVLLVEDDPAVRRSLQLLLHANGFDVRSYASSQSLLLDEAALEAACLIADYYMGDANGVATLAGLRAKGWEGAAILITAYPSAELETEARSAGFSAVFEKPLRKHILVKTVERLVHPSKSD